MLRIYLRKVRLNQGGYDNRGRYFGITELPVWEFFDSEESRPRYIRGKNREEVKRLIVTERYFPEEVTLESFFR